ncbi:aspartate aminotransferase family protein [Rugamonas sp. A1-17]|nr:aspartate aminotransferase family protein [Rugamonas sp. A1-17]
MNVITLPEQGCDWDSLKQRMQVLQRGDWSHRDGRLPLHCYFAGEEVGKVAAEAYSMFASANALAPQAFPSCGQMEREVVAMVLDLLHRPDGGAGSMTSGGTESIILAVKAARDHARAMRHAHRPNIVIPESAHPAFDKAAQLLGLDVRRVPVADDYRCDVAAMEAALDDETVLLVASAPSLPYGLIDRIEAMAALALRKRVWLHVDSCIGGMLAPFVQQLGYPVPAFDFRLPGVRSMSVDLHKFGYAAKGASLILYRDAADQQFQFSRFNRWPKGDYFTPTLAGTRSGGAIASAWAVMRFLGREGYLHISRQVMQLRDRYLAGLAALPSVQLLGTPELSVVTFTTRSPSHVFALADGMRSRGWYMSLVASPPAIQQTVNLVHAALADQYFDDLRAVLHDVLARGTEAPADRQQLVVTY